MTDLSKKIMIGALLVEIPTAMARFGLGLESTRDTASTIGRFTFGLRIHHGYVGILLLLIGTFLVSNVRFRKWVLILGGSLALSDAIHHFIVLWLLTGSPQFDVWYPGF